MFSFSENVICSGVNDLQPALMSHLKIKKGFRKSCRVDSNVNMEDRPKPTG